MSDSLSPRLGLPFLASQQAQKHVVLNEALARLDALTQLCLESRKTAAPPALPDEGACYLVPDAAAGEWAGRQGQIARFEAGGWIFLAPAAGWLAWIREEACLIAHDGTGWRSAAAPVMRAVAVDFGAEGSRTASVRLAVEGAAPGARVAISPALSQPEGVSADELEMDMLAAAARVSAAGEVHIIAASLGAPVSGLRNFILMIEQGAL